MANYKILIILTQAFDPDAGGVQRSTYKMSNYFASKDQEAHIFSFRTSGHINPDFAVVHHAQKTNGHLNSENIAYLEEIIDKISPDIVINQNVYERGVGKSLFESKQKKGFLLLGCLRNTLFPVVKNLDSYRKNVVPKPIQPIFSNSVGKKLLLQSHRWKHARDLRFILDVYDYFILFGEPNKKELEYFVKDYKQDKIEYISNSIPEVLDEIPQKEKVILYLGRLDYDQKRSDLILPLWKKLMNQLPDWRMDIVGDGEALEDIKTQIKNEKLSRVNLLGKQAPDDYYKKAPIYFMTSAFEGFPNVLIEAQSFGAVPVIYDNYDMAGWIANDKKDAFLVPPFNVDMMAERIIFLAQNEEKRNSMANAALENAGKFTIERVGQSWMKLFDEKFALIEKSRK